MARSNSIETTKLQVTIDVTTDRLLGEIAALGIHGANRSEVGCAILRMWLWENQSKLRESGIHIRLPSAT